MAKRVCLKSGYKFEFEGKRNWRASKSDLWPVVMAKAMCGKQVGTRRIDGSAVVVVKVRSKHYAALPHAVVRPKSR